MENQEVTPVPGQNKMRKFVKWGAGATALIVIIVVIFLILNKQRDLKDEELSKEAIKASPEPLREEELSEEDIENFLKVCLRNEEFSKDGRPYNYYNGYYHTCKAVANRNPVFCGDNVMCQEQVDLAKEIDEGDLNACKKAPENGEEPCINLIKNIEAIRNNPKRTEEICKRGQNQKGNEVFCKVIVLKDESVCDEALELGCYVTYYKKLALLRDDGSYCDKIADVNQIKLCKEQIKNNKM